MVLAGIGKEETADSLTERLQEKFREHNEQTNRPYHLSISVGVVHFENDESSIEEVVARADRIMYEDKRRKNSRSVLAPEVSWPRIEAVA